MSLGEIMRKRREEMDITQDQVATQVCISKPYLSNIETGRARNPPSDGILKLLERALKFKEGELVALAHETRTPRDVRDRFEQQQAELLKLRSVVKQLKGKGKKLDAKTEALAAGTETLSAGVIVPIINKVAAGYPHYFTDMDYPPGVAEDYIRCPEVHDPQAFAARIVGDSMEPDYREGDIVVFSPNLQAHSGDDCYVRFVEGEGTTFKRYYQDDEKTVRLQPLNPAHSSQSHPVEKITGLWPAVYRIQRLRGM